MSEVRVAIVGGAGKWGQHYVNAYANHPDCRIVGFVDTAVERRHAMADYYGITAEYETVDQLLNDVVPDIVSIILPAKHNVGCSCVL
jgi:predicted dehydrogenase